jgi:NAD(P)-dependent dehydrogenase (short-subunit alcohol dehydrogenase family)
VTEVLRPGVLEGVRVRVAGAGPLGEAVLARFEALGALPADGDLGALVVDAAAVFAAASGIDAVRAALDGAWEAIQPETAGAKLILLLAPPPGDAHAEAARAGLENLARTLSIEWARLGIRWRSTRERRRRRKRSRNSLRSSPLPPARTTQAAASTCARAVARSARRRPGTNSAATAPASRTAAPTQIALVMPSV